MITLKVSVVFYKGGIFKTCYIQYNKLKCVEPCAISFTNEMFNLRHFDFNKKWINIQVYIYIYRQLNFIFKLTWIFITIAIKTNFNCMHC